MRRLFLAALPMTILLAAAACGDGPDKDQDAAAATANTTPTLAVNEQPQAPDTPIPAPSAIPDDVPVLQVAASGKQYAPLRSDFAVLPKVTITANGKSYEGVTLATLAEKAGARAGATATIQGTRLDNLRLGAIRFGLAEIGASTVFVMGETGHLTLASSSVPPEQWLKDVTGIGLN